MSVSIQLPPLSESEQAEKEQLLVKFEQIRRTLLQRNLDRAVSLAMEAARGQGELVEHFAELGRRFGSHSARSTKPELRVIQGGRAGVH